MPLSEYEQRVLQQMEQQLRSEDPKLASDFGQRPRIDARRILIAIALVVVGLGALLGGVSQSWIWLGVIGFVIMLAGVMVLISGPKESTKQQTRRRGGPRRGPQGGGPRRGPQGGAPRGGSSAGGESFMKRQAERWERRQDGGQH